MKHSFGGSGNKRLLNQYTKGEKRAEGGRVSPQQQPVLSVERQKYGNDKDQEHFDETVGFRGFGNKAREAHSESKWARSGKVREGQEDRKHGGRVKR